MDHLGPLQDPGPLLRGAAVADVWILEDLVDRALVELKTTGQMTEAEKNALKRETAEKLEQVAELNARSQKYLSQERNFPYTPNRVADSFKMPPCDLTS